MKHIIVLMLISFPSFATAQTISLTSPIQCKVGTDCFIQNYVDQDTTAAYGDYACGSLSYDKHTGTDFRLPNMTAMRRGVAVVAAADGVVRGARDNMPDISIRDTSATSVKNRECGNGVVINHPAGFETQYCHMRSGSIVVKQGQQVKRGQKLGLVGLSGATEFPHVHFEVRRLGRVLDPFTSQSAGTKCGASSQALWAQSFAPNVRYQSTALLGAGFYPAEPNANQIRSLAAPVTEISRTSPVMTLWADIMGTRTGDVLSLSIFAPNGAAMATRDIPIVKHQAQMFTYIGERANEEGLPPGEYTGKIELKRPNKTEPIFLREVKVNVPY